MINERMLIFSPQFNHTRGSARLVEEPAGPEREMNEPASSDWLVYQTSFCRARVTLQGYAPARACRGAASTRAQYGRRLCPLTVPCTQLKQQVEQPKFPPRPTPQLVLESPVRHAP